MASSSVSAPMPSGARSSACSTIPRPRAPWASAPGRRPQLGGTGTRSWNGSRRRTPSRSAPGGSRPPPRLERMRVVIAKKLLSTVGGSEAQARALAAALRDRGHELTIVGLRPATRRPGIPDRVYHAPPGDVTVVEDGLTYRFIASPAALIEGTLPVSLIG